MMDVTAAETVHGMSKQGTTSRWSVFAWVQSWCREAWQLVSSCLACEHPCQGYRIKRLAGRTVAQSHAPHTCARGPQAQQLQQQQAAGVSSSRT